MLTETTQALPPRYVSPAGPPSAYAMLTRALSDPASVISDAIYSDWSLKLPGPRSPVVVSHPDAVRQVLLDKDGAFGRNRQLRMLMRRAWGKGLAAAEGESWSRQRQAAAPAFKPAAVQSAVPAMAAAAERAARSWSTDAPIDLSVALARIVTEIVMTTLLTGLDDADLDAIAADVPPFIRAAAHFGLLDLLPVPDAWIDRLRGMGRGAPEQRLRAVAARLAAARATPPDRVQDIAALMRGAGPLADNLLGFLPAGLETTAQAAAWGLYLLALYPDWQDAVYREALAADATAPTLPIGRQVVQETLRLYPPGPILVRAALRHSELQDHRLHTGQVVILPVFAIHRHRQLWDRPDAFDPDRFAPGAAYDRGAFLPFGAGPRLCIAAAFAQTEIAVMMAVLLRHFRFTPAAPEPVISLKTTTHSLTGLHVIATPRRG
mgnify:FL=1